VRDGGDAGQRRQSYEDDATELRWDEKARLILRLGPCAAYESRGWRLVKKNAARPPSHLCGAGIVLLLTKAA
jgi:hypothetical protein